jgi:hypothetical protein
VVDKNNVKWIGTQKGLCSYHNGVWNAYTPANSPLPSEQINDLALDKEGVLWITTNSGIVAFNGKDWIVYNTKNSGLPAVEVQNISIDRDNNKWMGTNFYGLVCFSGFTVMGKVTDEKGNPMPNTQVQVGKEMATTNEQGIYRVDVANGTNLEIKPTANGYSAEPPSRSIIKINKMELTNDFVLKREVLTATDGKGPGKVTITPYLEQGYITISFDGTEAEVEIKSNTKVMRNIPNYKRGNKINISKFPRGSYKITVRTDKWEKTLTLNKKL